MDLPTDYNHLSQHNRRLVREEYVNRQDGNCCHCNEPLSGPPVKHVTDKYIIRKFFPIGFFNWPVHLHHCHDTGMTIGAVHNYCNAVLWQYHGV